MKKLALLFLLISSFAYSQTMPNIWVPTSGAANTYSTNITNFGGSYNNKIAFVKFNITNTGTSTIAINGLSAIPLRLWNGSAYVLLASGDIKVDRDYRISYDNVNGWFRLDVGGGSGGVYGGNSPTTVTVGGLNSGSSIIGNTYDQIIQAILAPYVNPIFNSFSVSNAQTVEVGTTLSGSKTFSWGINVNSGTISGVDLYDITAASTLLAGTPNDGTEARTITTIQLNSNGATQSWRAIGNDTGGGPATFNSNSYTVTGRYFRFFGPVSSSPANSASVLAISAGTFHTGATTLTLNTGNTQTKFIVALPPSVTISSVIDVTALNAVITSSYVLTGTINVLDAGGTNRSYNIYEMNIGAPYSTSHNHSITTSN